MYPEEYKNKHINRQVRRMRIFDFNCPQCQTVVEKFIDLYEDVQIHCKECGYVMEKMPPFFRINMGPVPLTGHWDDNLETFVRTNNHRKEVMLEKGVTEKGATPKTGQAWV